MYKRFVVCCPTNQSKASMHQLLAHERPSSSGNTLSNVSDIMSATLAPPPCYTSLLNFHYTPHSALHSLLSKRGRTRWIEGWRVSAEQDTTTLHFCLSFSVYRLHRKNVDSTAALERHDTLKFMDRTTTRLSRFERLASCITTTLPPPPR